MNPIIIFIIDLSASSGNGETIIARNLNIFVVKYTHRIGFPPGNIVRG